MPLVLITDSTSPIFTYSEDGKPSAAIIMSMSDLILMDHVVWIPGGSGHIDCAFPPTPVTPYGEIKLFLVATSSAAQMLPHTTKAYDLVWSLRDLMSLLGIMPSRPSRWEDPYPLRDPKSRIQRIEERAESTLTRNLSQVASSSKKPRRLRWPS